MHSFTEHQPSPPGSAWRVRKHLQEFLLQPLKLGLLPPEHGEAMKGFLYAGIYYMSRDLMRIKLEWLSKAGGKLLEFPNS